MGRRWDERHLPAAWFTRRHAGQGRGGACAARRPARKPASESLRLAPARGTVRICIFMCRFVSLSAVSFRRGNVPPKAGASRFPRRSARPCNGRKPMPEAIKRDTPWLERLRPRGQEALLPTASDCFPPRAPARALCIFVSLPTVNSPCRNNSPKAGVSRFSGRSPSPQRREGGAIRGHQA